MISGKDGFYVPPGGTIPLVDSNSVDSNACEFKNWTEIVFRFDALKLEYRASPQLLLHIFPPAIPTKKQARGKDKEAVEVRTKIVLCSELSKNEWVGFLPPGKYHSMRLAFGDAGASFFHVEATSKSSNRIMGSRNFMASAVQRIFSMAHSPNPETVRRLKTTARSLLSLFNGLKDDLVGVKPLEEIPDGPYGLEEYDVWFAKNCSIGAKEEVFANYFISTFSLKPLISVVLPVRNANPLLLAATVHSVIDQLYDNFELIISDAGSSSEGTLRYLDQIRQIDSRIRVISSDGKERDTATAVNDAVMASHGEYVAFLCQDDILNRDAFFWLVEKINDSPRAELVYSDEDCIDEGLRYVLPKFKTDWNLLLLTSHNYVGNIVMASRRLSKLLKFRSEAGSSWLYDFVLRSALNLDEDTILHVPRILYHRRLRTGNLAVRDVTASDLKCRLGALEDFLRSWSPGATVDGDTDSDFARVHFPVAATYPDVAIVIPTRDTPEVLERCIHSLVNFTKYPNFKIHVIDNQSVEAKTLALFGELKTLHSAEIHTYDKPFNYSAMHNWLISQLDSEFICLLNNDTEIIEESWLDELVSLVSLPGFGAAGSLLLYPDRSIQHAGIALGIGGIAAHVGVGDAPDNPGYSSRNLVPQELSAVTAACMLIRRDLYELVGGMNEERLPVSFNDVDLCLKIRAAKYKIAWTPNSRLIHHESKSRGIDHEDEFKKLRAAGEMSYCALKWRSEIANDPYFNPNFDLKSDPYQMLASLPRLELTLKPYNKT